MSVKQNSCVSARAAGGERGQHDEVLQRAGGRQPCRVRPIAARRGRAGGREVKREGDRLGETWRSRDAGRSGRREVERVRWVGR